MNIKFVLNRYLENAKGSQYNFYKVINTWRSNNAGLYTAYPRDHIIFLIACSRNTLNNKRL